MAVPSQAALKNGRRLPPSPPIVACRAWARPETAEGGCPHVYSYAAAPWLSNVFSAPTLILICFGLASAFLPSLIFNTPLSYWADTPSASTVLGSVKDRVKLPYCRSTRR